jgi:micrococcal nuclease
MNKTINKAGKYLFQGIVVALLAYAAYALFRQFTTPCEKPLNIGLSELRMVRIVDGDTGELSNGESVRYLGIDTPEEGEQFYFDALRENSELCLDKPVRLEYDVRRRDKYGRLLAYVFIDDTIMVNAVLVRKGLACVYTYPTDQKNMEYRSLLTMAQINARAEKRGIWSLPAPEPIEKSYLGNPNTFRFHRPSCPAAQRGGIARMLEYPTRDDFLDLGFSPCRNCKP